MPGKVERIPWSKPQGFEIDHRPTQGTGWDRVATSDGRWSHCDVYFQGPLLGYNGLPVRLLGKVGSIWVELVATTIGTAPLFSPTAGFGSATVIKWRGQPVMAFAVEIAQVVALVLPLATWRMECWGEECCINTLPNGQLPIPPIVIPPIVVAPTPWRAVSSGGLAPGGVWVASAAPVLVNGAFARNDSGARVWLMVFDLAAPPAPGALPILPSEPVDPNEPAAVDMASAQMTNGLVLASSSTPTPYTPDPTAALDLGALVF